jgi:chromate transporter
VAVERLGYSGFVAANSAQALKEETPRDGSSAEVLRAFLRLGCTSFGGPVAHLGYFRRELVVRRAWCSEAVYAEIVGLAQSLPGPTSSQVGFALGLLRAGWMGGIAAWLGFTLPSAMLMVVLAAGHADLRGAAPVRVFHALQLVAVAVVAQAVVAMRRSLAPDLVRVGIAVVGVAIALLVPWAAVNLVVIGIGAVAGLLLCRTNEGDAGTTGGESFLRISWPKTAGVVAAGAFVALLAMVSFVRTPRLAIFAAFYRTGALVFGGGHVVLPLLDRAVADRGWVSQQSVLAGYGAAQAVPGPLFSFAAYLGEAIRPAAHPVANAFVALVGLFLPGLFLMAAVMPFWSALRGDGRLRAALAGVNAGVVGLLAAALIRPLWPSTVHSVMDGCIALAALALLHVRGVQPWMVVVAVAVGGLLFR